MVVEAGVPVPKTRIVSIPWLARHYGFSETLGYNMANHGTLVGCRRMGSSWKIYLEVFDAWFRAGGLD